MIITIFIVLVITTATITLVGLHITFIYKKSSMELHVKFIDLINILK
jgi:hypothetical protein